MDENKAPTVEAEGQNIDVNNYVPSGVPWQVSELIKRTKVVTLTDGATVDINASDGGIFALVATGSRTINVPTGAKDGWRLIIKHTASGGARTLSLTTGSAGAFRFGTTITALTATTSGTSDYIGCIYNLTDDRWDVCGYVKGF